MKKNPILFPHAQAEVADVSGAGDTVIATLAVAKACGATVREAAMMANRAAGIVIEELGIVPIERAQLFEALMEDLEEKKYHGEGLGVRVSIFSGTLYC